MVLALASPNNAAIAPPPQVEVGWQGGTAPCATPLLPGEAVLLTSQT
jgi:hypothetical protein